MESKANPNLFLNLNISGKRYKLLRSTALRLHGSLFAELAHLDEKGAVRHKAPSVYIPETNEFYLERPVIAFKHVLTFVLTGKLHRPVGVCGEILTDELRFWKMIGSESTVKVASCCLSKIDEGNETEGGNEEDHQGEIEQPKTFLRKIWLCCEEPSSSAMASVSTVFRGPGLNWLTHGFRFRYSTSSPCSSSSYP